MLKFKKFYKGIPINPNPALFDGTKYFFWKKGLQGIKLGTHDNSSEFLPLDH